MVVPLGPEVGKHNGHDELNVARLSLISAQSRVPIDYTNWTRTYQARTRLAGKPSPSPAPPTGQVVPHGLYNDVMLAIINLYLEDGTVRVSMHRLLQAGGLNVCAHDYREVQSYLWRPATRPCRAGSQGKQWHVDATFNHLSDQTGPLSCWRQLHALTDQHVAKQEARPDGSG